jgi:hypothetical protein
MYAVMRIAKLKTMGEVGVLGKHNERERETRNADAARLGDNERLAGTGDWCADVERRLADARYRRPDAVLCLEHVLTASKDFFAAHDADRLAAWRDAAMDWLRTTYGPENVVAAVLHNDELTPHIQAAIVPVDERDHLNAKHWTGGAAKLSALQDSYARAMERFGLERGVKGSVADHQTVKEFYAKIEAPTPAPEIVREAVAVEKPGRIVGNPEKWASEQTERIVAELTPTLDDALTKAAHYAGQAATAEANIVVLQERVRALERDYTTLAAQVRGLDLRDVIERLGGEQDRHDKHKWRLDGEHISITGEKFYNHDRREGGGGAIDLVKHAIPGTDFKQAVAYLSDEGGRELALTAAASYGARQAQQQAEEVIERLGRGERGARVPAPTPDADRWPQVRAYLVEQRGIPRGMVDTLHERGDIYADARGNAVFVRRDAGREIVGASLRGTAPGSEFQGLALGTRRDEGHFSFTLTLGKPSPHDTPQYHLVESPIDALSRAVLAWQAGETGPHVFISTDGQGELPRRQIDEALANRGLVRCGFDNDQGGAALWAQVKEAYPRAEAIERERPPAGAKDWNDALRAAQAQAREEARPSGRAPAKEKDYHDR